MTDSKAVITDEMVQRALVGFGPFPGSMKNEQEKMRAALEAAFSPSSVTIDDAVKVVAEALNLQSKNVLPGFSKTQAEWVIESLIKAGYNIEKAEENETESLVTRDELEDESPDEEKLPYVTVDLQVKIYHETDEGLNTTDAYEPPYGYLAVREVSVVNTSFHYNITDIDPATADDLDPDGWLVDSIRDVLFDRDAVEDEEDEDYA